MEQHAVRQDDGYHYALLQEVGAVQQRAKVSRRLWRQAVILEGHALAGASLESGAGGSGYTSAGRGGPSARLTKP